MLQYFGLVLFVFYLQVHQGFSVKCYSCSSQNNEACIKPYTSNISMVECSLEKLYEIRNQAEKIKQELHKAYNVDPVTTSQNFGLSCLKHVVKVENKVFVLRGCQLAERKELDICHKLKTDDKPYLTTVNCEMCNKDGCNSANNHFTTLGIFLPILWAILRKIIN